MKYAVFDIETSGRRTFGRFCNPLDSLNEITCYGLLYPSGEIHQEYEHAGIDRSNCKFIPDDTDLLIGQNIKFDLLYIWESDSLKAFLDRGGIVWDTLLAEYLLRGQQWKGGLDLDSLAIKYGGTLKDDAIKEQYKAGKLSKEIDKEQLLEYNRWDVRNTNTVFLGQYKEAKRLNMLPLMRVYMQHLLAVCEMEYNGLHIDQKIGKSRRLQIENDLEVVENILLEKIDRETDFPKDIEFTLNSPKDWSLFLFGGNVATIEDIPTGEFYKGGKTPGAPKTKKQKVIRAVSGVIGLVKEEWQTKREGVYSVENEVLTYLLKQDSTPKDIKPIIQHLLAYRGLFKLLSTYYYKEHLNADGEVKKVSGILAKVHPKTSTLHPEFKMSLTETGRLSSSNPNSQNLPAEILDMFTSRYEDGEIIEFDFSQLEVVLQAYLAQSDRMIQDIKEGKDFHRLRLAYALDMSYEDVIDVPEYSKKRKEIAKPISFQKAYGASPQFVSDTTGIPLETVEKVFNKEDEEYPEIKTFYNSIASILSNNRKITNDLQPIRNKETGVGYFLEGERQGYGIYTSMTKKKYVFKERAVKTKRGDVWRYWYMPEVQNYPVQGLAADIVSMQVGELFKYLLTNRDKCVLINEVHDSVIIDCKKEYKDLIVSKVGAIMSSVGENLEKYFGLKFNVPIKVDVKTGKSWLNCKED